MDKTLIQYEKFVNQTINIDELPVITKFNEIAHRLKYYKPIKAYHTYHNGQRKLFLSEIEFLSMYYKKTKYVIYAGAAPSWKMYYIATLFPSHKIILVDPNPFEVLYYKNKSHKDFADDTEVIYLDPQKPNTWLPTITAESKTRVFLINDYYKDATSEILKSLGGTLFISDIRTSDNDDAPSDLDILWNGAQQMNWISILKPLFYMVKFRTPYLVNGKTTTFPYQKSDFDLAIKNGIDFVSEYNSNSGKYTYLDGEIYLQAWSGYKSTETRLIGQLDKNGQILKKTYDILEYEEKLFYFNTILRMYGYYYNNHASKTLGFDHCYDCARENDIFQKYASLVSAINVRQAVKTLSLYTRRDLWMTTKEGELPHGYMIVPDIKWYKERLLHTAEIKVQFQLPKRIYDSKDLSMHTFAVMLHNITNLMPESDKKIYIEAMSYARKQTPALPKCEVSSIKGKFPFSKYLLYRSCMSSISAANTFNLLQILTHNNYEVVIMEHDRELVVLPKNCAKMLCRLFPNLLIIYSNSLSNDINEESLHQGYKPGIYETAKSCRELKLPYDLAKKTVLVPKYKGEEKNCQMFAVILAKLYNDVMMSDFEGYSVTTHAVMDAYCYERTDFNHPEIQLAKKNGFDMKEQLAHGKFNYLSGIVKVVPYSALVFSGVIIDGKKSSLKLVPYSIEDLTGKTNYLNSIVRSYQVFKNPLVNENIGFDNCMDCALSGSIIEQAAKKIGETNPKALSKTILKTIFPGTLYQTSHGYLYTGSDQDLLNGFNNEYLSRYSLRNAKK